MTNSSSSDILPILMTSEANLVIASTSEYILGINNMTIMNVYDNRTPA